MAIRDAQLKVILSLEKKGFDKGVKSTKASLTSLGKDVLKTGAVIGGVVVAIGAAGKALYDIGKRGAIVTQTADSFDFLSEKLGLAPDLLEQLRKASRGTVDDMTLMSSTATLLAGASDELGKSLGNATPQLLEIAKAANKLNPSLGTTSHMYESIALGIKRASPLILDNLGLTIKIGQANSDFAAKLGKSVDALTAEEKQMALLNATLAAGDLLIAQVGGTTESAADSFERMEAELQNTKDELAKGFTPRVTEAVTWVNNLVTGLNAEEAALSRLIKIQKRGVISQKQLNKWTNAYFKGLISLEELINKTTNAENNYTAARKVGNKAMYATTEGLRIVRNEYILAAEATGKAETASWNFASAIDGSKGAIEGLTSVLHDQYNNALKAATSSTYDFERMKLVLKIATGELEGATKEETSANIANALSILDSINQMEILTGATRDGEISHRDMRAAIADGIVTTEEFNSLMGITTGTMNEAEAEAYQLRNSIAVAGGQMDTATIQGQRLVDTIDKLKDKTITITTIYVDKHTNGNGNGNGNGPTPDPDPEPEPEAPPPPPPPPREYEPVSAYLPTGISWGVYQHGGGFTVPSGYPNDSFLAPMRLSSGEQVTVTPRADVGRENGQPNTINYNSLNIYTSAPIESDVPDLLLLRAWASG